MLLYIATVHTKLSTAEWEAHLLCEHYLQNLSCVTVELLLVVMPKQKKIKKTNQKKPTKPQQQNANTIWTDNSSDYVSNYFKIFEIFDDQTSNTWV